MNKITIGIIGAGYIGKEHARTIRLVQNFFGNSVSLVGIADKNKKAAEDAARHFQISYATDDIDAVINDARINTIFVCLPTAFHIDVVRKVAAAGKNIFCEKPFAVSLEKAKEVHQLLVKNKIRHQVGFVLRYTPAYHALKKIIEQRAEESDLRTILLRDDQVFPIKGLSHFTDWRSNVELAGAGVLAEHGIHDIDILEWFFGKMKRVSARIKNYAGHKGIEDYMEVRFETEKGVAGNMVHLWHEIQAHQSIRHFEIFFQKALIEADTYDMHHISVRDSAALHIYERPDLYAMIKNDPLFKDISHREDVVFLADYYACQVYWFLRNLLEGAPLTPTIDDGLRAFVIADACYRSAAKDSEWIMV
ncbi:MAG: Gfo/Idh/MocA family oxidoreductase [Candidatus Liptonbacteria bacterium]|nr:Gfo/Idh/MocA family oxidoreductase [Candidatus Liptonbacteria bacterium]